MTDRERLLIDAAYVALNKLAKELLGTVYEKRDELSEKDQISRIVETTNFPFFVEEFTSVVNKK